MTITQSKPDAPGRSGHTPFIMNVDFFDQCACAWERNEGLYGEERIRGLLEKCKDHGFSAVMWRTSVCGKVAYRSRVMTVFDGEYRISHNSLAAVLQKIDPLEVAVRHAHRLGLKIYAWVTLFDSYYPGLEDHFFARNPHLLMLSKDGKSSLRGIPCYACDETRAYRWKEIEELSSYGVDGILYSMNSHNICTKAYGDLQEEGEFGFNPPIADAFRSKYGKDIRKDDYRRPDLWEIHGEFLTTFLEQAKARLTGNQGLYVSCGGAERDGAFYCGGVEDNEIYYWYGHSRGQGLDPYPFWDQVRIKMDLRKYISSRIVDGVILQIDDVQRLAAFRDMYGDQIQYLLWTQCFPHEEDERTPIIKRQLQEASHIGIDGVLFHEAITFEYGSGKLWQLLKQSTAGVERI